MTLNLKSMVVFVALSWALITPVAAFAQAQAPEPGLPQKGRLAGPITPSVAAGTATGQVASAARRPHRGLNPVATGALIGAATALVGTALAAHTYGNNETGGFCSRCMLEWSSFTVPVGVGIGAAIGYGVKRARRTVTAAPIFSRNAAAVFVTARF